MDYPIVSREDVRHAYPDRPNEVRKYDYGLVTVIGGSEFYSGAPALSALAAFRGGADMARVIAPKRAADIIASFSPILAAYPLEGSHLTRSHVAELISMANASQQVSREHASVVIGGGLGRSEETQDAVREFISQVSLPVVVDADAIHAIAKDPKRFYGRSLVVTPSKHEFELLTGRSVRDFSHEECVVAVQEEALRLGMTILLKGRVDIISNGNETMLNKEESHFLSVRGVGDTLAGIVGALLARGVTASLACAVGAYVNAKAGSMAGQEKGEGLVATDLIERIPEAIRG